MKSADSRRPRPRWGLILLCGVVGACAPYQVVSGEIGRIVPAERPASVRITLPDGDRKVVDDPVTRGDTLMGQTDGEETRVSAEDVAQLELRRLSLLRTQRRPPKLGN